jgi:hypothetical protein
MAERIEARKSKLETRESKLETRKSFAFRPSPRCASVGGVRFSFILLLLMAWFRPASAAAQAPPLQRGFTAGSAARYRVRLTVRTSLAGERAVERGGQGYVSPFEHAASGELAWVAEERVAAVSRDGTAEIEETLENFTPISGQQPAGPEAQKLAEAIRGSLERWSQPGRIVLRYRVSRQGELLGLGPTGVPLLGEANPPLVTLWLLHALRPETPLPGRPLRVGERWTEPHAVRLEEWSGVRAWESGEWLAPLDPSEAAARLLVSQQIIAEVTAGREKPPEGAGAARFSSDSLATVSLDDASVLEAARTAVREISWTLNPVAGLPRRPEFRLTLAAEVRIERCHGPCD